ncbi:sensor histidine kinase [Amycolatopsis sp. H20-H5]|uniref:sensor histidine kinase n=1 Tax=Amycolatopsis sp. H20-H5 TaxID=3046309 RepID=UPI002DBA3F07|nr:sensor histidine kinase [Amycolatopsis sp. H20-H5]MEC3974145.1 sensor histidine kinase [Amycolatopsis sp. H20-H5]
MNGLKIDWRGSLWTPIGGEETGWRPWHRRIERYLPYAMLLVSTVASLAKGGQSGDHRLGTLVLAGIAAGWLLVSITMVPEKLRDNAVVITVSFAGLLTTASLLESRDLVFLLFMIVALLHAMRLRPVPLAFLALATTSVMLQTLPVGGPVKAFGTEPVLWGFIVVVQTLAIGGGGLLSASVARQNEERRKTLDALAAAQEENAGLQRQLLAQAREAGMLDERQRLSQEIHDTLAQGFTGIITQLEAASEARANPGEWDRHLANAKALARENLTEARRSVRALHPEALDSATLPDALREVARQWSERTGVEVRFTTTGSARELHPEIEATLLRITQEALANVGKHAAASITGLTLSYMEDQVTLDVRDDGRGFDPDAPRCPPAEGGFGLRGMRQRVGRLAGTLHVESEPGGGTAVSANVPAIPVGVQE